MEDPMVPTPDFMGSAAGRSGSRHGNSSGRPMQSEVALKLTLEVRLNKLKLA
jgi:hypothetical protein